MTSFSLGVNTCFAVKRWPQPQEWARIVRDDLGVDVVQHSLDLADLGSFAAIERQAADVRAACAHAGLELHSTFTGLAAYSSNLLLHPDERARDLAEDWYRRAILFTAASGAQATGGHIGAFSVDDFSNGARVAELLTDLERRLTRLRRFAAEHRVRALYVENLAARREPSVREEIDHLLAPATDDLAAVELCLDVGHQCVAGTHGPERDPYAWLRSHGSSAGCIQLQQSDSESDHHWPFTAAANAAGRIDADRVLATLRAAGAERVTLLLEVIPPFEADDGGVLRDLVASVAYWRTAIDACVDRQVT